MYYGTSEITKLGISLSREKDRTQVGRPDLTEVSLKTPNPLSTFLLLPSLYPLSVPLSVSTDEGVVRSSSYTSTPGSET